MVGDTVAQQKIKLICIACDACFLFRFEVIDWSEKHMAIKDLALYWEKEKKHTLVSKPPCSIRNPAQV